MTLVGTTWSKEIIHIQLILESTIQRGDFMEKAFKFKSGRLMIEKVMTGLKM
jgi:hypothetical protein